VAAVQCLLRQQGHGRLDVHGRFDRATQRAVRAARSALGLPVNGAVTAPLWTALLSSGPRPVLKVGSTGEPVRHLQRALTAALDERVGTSGVLTKQTAVAVSRYQRATGLKPTGVVDQATWSRLQAGAIA